MMQTLRETLAGIDIPDDILQAIDAFDEAAKQQHIAYRRKLCEVAAIYDNIDEGAAAKLRLLAAKDAQKKKQTFQSSYGGIVVPIENITFSYNKTSDGERKVFV